MFLRATAGASARSDRWALVLADVCLCGRVWTTSGEGDGAKPLVSGSDPIPFHLKYLTYALGATGPPRTQKPRCALQSRNGKQRIRTPSSPYASSRRMDASIPRRPLRRPLEKRRQLVKRHRCHLLPRPYPPRLPPRAATVARRANRSNGGGGTGR